MAKKIKAAIFTTNPSQIYRVYGEERLKKLAEETDLLPEFVTPENFNSMPVDTIEVGFSTWGMIAFTEEQLDKMPNFKALFYAAGATDAFCRPLLARNIAVISAWLANARPVAEYTLAHILLGMKNFLAVSNDLRQQGRAAWHRQNVGPGSYGKTVTLIGAGAIASRVEELLKNFDLNVVVVPSRKERRTISLEEAFASSQVVSNHLPDRDDNVGVLNKALFESMPPHAVFINTGRGRQVNEKDLAEVLQDRPDLTAILDVTWPEPPEEDSPLYKLPNVWLTPHIAGSLNDEVRRMADYAIEDFHNYAEGKPFRYQVSESMLLTSAK